MFLLVTSSYFIGYILHYVSCGEALRHASNSLTFMGTSCSCCGGSSVCCVMGN